MNHTDSYRWNGLYEQFLRDWPAETSSVGVLIGCSGGADSVALTRLVHQAFRLRCSAKNPSKNPSEDAPLAPLVIAHFNHGLRGVQSDADENFVSHLSESLQCQFVSKHSDRCGTQEYDEASLRTQRRDYFVEAAKRTGCRYIALAHTADDQAETVLHNALRGTGPAGLSGMKTASAIDEDLVIRRPLLNVRRNSIREALGDLKQTWREDESNHSSVYTRNWIRNEVLPFVETRLPHASDALIRLAANQSQVLDLMTRLSEQWLDTFVDSTSVSDDRIRIGHPCSKPFITHWPHDASLAKDPAVITAACQLLYTRVGLARGEMKQEHWSQLTNAILDESCQDESFRSRGHLPGHTEIRTNRNFVELLTAKR